MTKHSSDEGFSLIEVLVAVTIMGVAVVAIISAIMTSVVASDVHRENATGETVLRSYAETTKEHAAANYAPCATTYTPTFTPVAGFTASPVQLAHRSGSVWVDGAPSACSSATPPTDVVQRLTLQVQSDDGHSTESTQIVVRKP